MENFKITLSKLSSEHERAVKAYEDNLVDCDSNTDFVEELNVLRKSEEALHQLFQTTEISKGN